MAKEPEELIEERLLREQPDRLIMVKRHTRKEDGRYLIYYEFRREPADGSGTQEAAISPGGCNCTGVS